MNELLNASRRFVKRNASTILTCVGGVGVVATSIMAVKATPKALRLLEEAKEEKGEDLTPLETFQVAGPVYIPAILTGVTTLSCIFGANALNKRQQASLISAYALLDNSYKEFKAKTKEVYGEDAEEKVFKAVMEGKYDEEDIVIDDEHELFYDIFSGQYFQSTMSKVIHAEYLLNRRLALTNYVCLNEFYDLLEIPTVPGGDELGWSGGEMSEMHWYTWIEFEHRKVTMDDGLECTIVSMPYEPYTDYLDY